MVVPGEEGAQAPSASRWGPSCCSSVPGPASVELGGRWTCASTAAPSCTACSARRSSRGGARLLRQGLGAGPVPVLGDAPDVERDPATHTGEHDEGEHVAEQGGGVGRQRREEVGHVGGDDRDEGGEPGAVAAHRDAAADHRQRVCPLLADPGAEADLLRHDDEPQEQDEREMAASTRYQAVRGVGRCANDDGDHGRRAGREHSHQQEPSRVGARTSPGGVRAPSGRRCGAHAEDEQREGPVGPGGGWAPLHLRRRSPAWSVPFPTRDILPQPVPVDPMRSGRGLLAAGRGRRPHRGGGRRGTTGTFRQGESGGTTPASGPRARGRPQHGYPRNRDPAPVAKCDRGGNRSTAPRSPAGMPHGGPL